MAEIAPESKLIIPFDYPHIDDEAAQVLLAQIEDSGVTAKIGTEISGGCGWPYPIDIAHQHGLRVFADTKAADIPNTISKTLEAHVFPQIPYMVNIHAGAGEDALDAFIATRRKVQGGDVKLGVGSLAIAVTVLTSKDKEIAKEYNGRTALEQVLYYADLAVDHGFDGVVCSPEELPMLSARKKTKDILKVTPGVRPLWASAGDQKRVRTPAQAVAMGATHLVIGRPITSPPPEIGTPENAIESILEEIEGAA